MLDYLSDFICCLYGRPGAYGVVTLPFSVREGINIFLAGAAGGGVRGGGEGGWVGVCVVGVQGGEGGRVAGAGLCVFGVVLRSCGGS